MKNIVLLILLLLFLVGCGPAITDPYQAIELANAQIQATQRADRAAREATLDAEERATIVAAQTAGAAQIEIQLLQARIESTKQAFALEQEGLRYTEIAQASTRAASEYDLQQTSTAGAAHATQTAIAALAGIEGARVEQAKQTAELWNNIIPLVGVIVLASLCILLFLIIRRINDYLTIRNKRLELDSYMSETRLGTIAWIEDENGIMIPRLMSEMRVLNYNNFSGLRETRALPLPNTNPQEDNDQTEKDLAMQLVTQSIHANGADANKVLSWRTAGWSSEKWQRAISFLRGRGLVKADSTGTYANGDLENVRYALETGASPAPGWAERASTGVHNIAR